MGTRLIRIALVGLVLTVVAAGAGYGAPGGSQTVSVAAAAGIDITVPAAASIAATAPGSCGNSAPTTVTVSSNKVWNLNVRANASYPDGKPMNGATPMVNTFQYMGGDVSSFTDITTSYASLFTLNQAKGTNIPVAVTYHQCVDYLDDPATYSIVVEYLGVQF